DAGPEHGAHRGALEGVARNGADDAPDHGAAADLRRALPGVILPLDPERLGGDRILLAVDFHASEPDGERRGAGDPPTAPGRRDLAPDENAGGQRSPPGDRH